MSRLPAIGATHSSLLFTHFSSLTSHPKRLTPRKLRLLPSLVYRSSRNSDCGSTGFRAAAIRATPMLLPAGQLFSPLPHGDRSITAARCKRRKPGGNRKAFRRFGERVDNEGVVPRCSFSPPAVDRPRRRTAPGAPGRIDGNAEIKRGSEATGKGGAGSRPALEAPGYYTAKPLRGWGRCRTLSPGGASFLEATGLPAPGGPRHITTSVPPIIF